MTTGFILLIVIAVAYFSNWLNWKFLNSNITRYLYYIGALIHESSHALVAVVLGSHIHEFKVFSEQPRVVYGKPKIPLVGNMLISLAPLFGGLIFLYLVNSYVLHSQFAIHSVVLENIYNSLLSLIFQINLLHWQTWVLILLFINVGAMLSPSWQDIKNMWPALIIFLFIDIAPLSNLLTIALQLILVGIVIQVGAIILVKIIELVRK
ncbi:MAG TPA: hypothetical protein VL335_01820 [Candidatus Paceibacterota bacterium]|jgi:hypothetical protein|nr:hypothetical protein [Candidatus Paceibacterota bacterium]